MSREHYFFPCGASPDREIRHSGCRAAPGHTATRTSRRGQPALQRSRTGHRAGPGFRSEHSDPSPRVYRPAFDTPQSARSCMGAPAAGVTCICNDEQIPLAVPDLPRADLPVHLIPDLPDLHQRYIGIPDYRPIAGFVAVNFVADCSLRRLPGFSEIHHPGPTGSGRSAPTFPVAGRASAWCRSRCPTRTSAHSSTEPP